LRGEDLVNAAAEENVLVQIEHLCTLPVIAARVSSGKVKLHGWMYKLATGEIFNFDSQIGQFVKFGAESRESGNGASAAKANPRRNFVTRERTTRTSAVNASLKRANQRKAGKP
jgi:carbonic anhydrase